MNRRTLLKGLLGSIFAPLVPKSEGAVGPSENLINHAPDAYEYVRRTKLPDAKFKKLNTQEWIEYLNQRNPILEELPMNKQQSLQEPGCLVHAEMDEEIFVLLARDPAAPVAIRAWIDERIRLGKNTEYDEKIIEAATVIRTMERQYDERYLHVGSGKLSSSPGTTAREPLPGDDDLYEEGHPRNIARTQSSLFMHYLTQAKPPEFASQKECAEYFFNAGLNYNESHKELTPSQVLAEYQKALEDMVKYGTGFIYQGRCIPFKDVRVFQQGDEQEKPHDVQD